MTLYEAVESVTSNGDGTLTALTAACGFCGDPGEVTVPDGGFLAWTYGQAPIREAMPDLPEEQRGQLATGTCAACQRRPSAKAPETHGIDRHSG